MKHSNFVRSIAMALTSVGLLLPSATMAAGLTPSSTNSQARSEILADVALESGGVLRGQIVDAQNKPAANQAVVLRSTGGQAVTAKTNEQGQFAFSGLKGGTYTAATQNGSGVYRLWAPETAPPRAVSSVLLVPAAETVRGQTIAGISRGTLVVLGVTGGIVAAGVVSQEDDDDDDDSSS